MNNKMKIKIISKNNKKLKIYHQNKFKQHQYNKQHHVLLIIQIFKDKNKIVD